MTDDNALAAIAAQAGDDRLIASLDAIDVPGVIAGRDGTLMVANRSFQETAPKLGIVWDDGRIGGRTAPLDTALKELLAALGGNLRASRGLPGRPMRMTIHRLSTTDDDGRVLLTMAARPERSEAEALRLTPVEESIVRHLSDGLNLREASLRLKIPYNTARKYVHTMLERTSSKTQAHLVARYLRA